MADVIPFSPPLYSATLFRATVDGAEWKFAGTICGVIDMATPAGTLSLTPDEIPGVIAALQSAREDVLKNSNPNSDPRIVER